MLLRTTQDHFVHTLPMGGSGSSCVSLPDSMPGGSVRVPGSYAQSGHSSGGGSQFTSSQ